MDINILLRPQQLHKEILAMQMKHDTLKSAAERTVSMISLAPGHGQGVNRKFETLGIEIADLDKAISQRSKEEDAAKEELSVLLAQMKNGLYIGILCRHYIEYKSISQISAEIGYSFRYTKQLHKLALTEYRNLAPPEHPYSTL